MALKKKEIAKQVEQLQEGQSLKFNLHPTFGGGTVTVRLNPKCPAKGEKKYQMIWEKDASSGEKGGMLWTTDKPKDAGGWIADRLGELT